MSYTREQILHTVNLLQPQLSSLPKLNLELQSLVTQLEKGQPVENEILELLASDDRLREQAFNRLNTNDQQNTTKSVTLPGNSPPIASTLRYQCAECNKLLKSPQLNLIPKCPTHPTAQVTAITTN